MLQDEELVIDEFNALCKNHFCPLKASKGVFLVSLSYSYIVSYQGGQILTSTIMYRCEQCDNQIVL